MDPTIHRGTAAVSDTYRAFGNREARGVSPVYEEWAIGVSQDAAVADLLATLPDGELSQTLSSPLPGGTARGEPTGTCAQRSWNSGRRCGP